MQEVAQLPTLADRINAEHRAVQGAVKSALEHAMNAGSLLREARAECPYGTWQAWVDDNFDGSLRTAQIYMYLSRHREEVGEAKAQSSACLSISGALHKLALAHVEKLPAPPPLQQQQVTLPVAEQPAKQPVERPTPTPLSLEDSQPSEDGQQEQGSALTEAARVREEEERVREAGRLLLYATKRLNTGVRLLRSDDFRPEDAAKGLAQMEDGARLLADLRAGVAWLEQVIEAAERQHAPEEG
jgi:hypothetical protein